MISMFRRYLDSWIVRGFFIVMVVAFVGWGISGSLLSLGGPPSWVAKIGNETIQIPAFQAEFQRALTQRSQNLPQGQTLSPEQRRLVGEQTLQRMVAQASLAIELKKLRIATPDSAVAAAARAMPAFRGPDGNFSKQVFDTVLRNNGFTEPRFLAELRADIAQRQLITAIGAPVVAPDLEVKPLFDAEFEKRSADMAMFPLTAAPEPPEPDPAQLQRWYDNHPDLYATPEFRRVKAIELTPQSVAPDITITDQELQTAYDEQKSRFVTPEKRSAEVISVGDEEKAKALAAQWRSTPDWAAMQKAAQTDGAAAISQDDATKVDFPDPDLAKAVFSDSADTVSDPIKGVLGWFVVKVTKITAGAETTFDAAKDKLRAQVLASKAVGLIDDRANKVDQLLGNGTSLDDLPSDLGLVGVTGTLNASGETQEGTPAPIPGPAELKSAIVAAAFQAHVGDQPQLTEVQTPSSGGTSYYALVVEKVVPPGKKPFDAVKDQVADDWKQDQRQRAENAAATAMMTAVQGGESFSDAATKAGVTPHISPLVTRNQTSPDIPSSLQRVLFGLKKGEATMVEVPDGFVVAQLAEVVPPDPATDKVGYDQAKTAITRSLQDDISTVFVDALGTRDAPRTNQSAFDSVVGSQ